MDNSGSIKRALVTGACGTVGSLLVEDLLKQGYIVCAYDHNENGLFKLNSNLGVAFRGRLKLFIGCIRDIGRLVKAMEGVNVVYHCAALKHVELGEYNPFECVQTNINGTQNVVEAAIINDVEKVVYTSSDKAVNPTGTMGASKLLGEKIIISANNFVGVKPTRFSVVRFGNILDSSGSVLEIFKKKLDEGSKIPITHMDMTRFIILQRQAIDLCKFAIDKMIGGEIFVSSMHACNIVDLARCLRSDHDLDIEVIGVKPGEKLYEELLTSVEAVRTYQAGEYLVVLPETMDYLDESARRSFATIYESQIDSTTPLKSSDFVMSLDEVGRFLSKQL